MAIWKIFLSENATLQEEGGLNIEARWKKKNPEDREENQVYQSGQAEVSTAQFTGKVAN